MTKINPARVNMLSATDLYGGAGIAAYRLLQGLAKLGVNAELFVQDKQSRHAAVFGPRSWFCRTLGRLYPLLDPLPKLVYPNRHRGAWSCGFLPNPCLPLKRLQDSDIVHLHWVGGGLLPIRDLRKLKRPIIWTLHDSWPFTGGCHIPYDCELYRQLCGDCPQLRSQRERDLSRITLQHKLRHWRDLEMTIIAPSRWIASLAATSTLFRDRSIKVIPNGLDLEVFAPFDKQEARKQLGLPQNARLILFSAFAGVANWNKGGDLLRDSLCRLCNLDDGRGILLLLAGSRRDPPAAYFPVPVVNYGVVNEDAKKRLIYAAADITAVPSRSENLCYVVMESMACGTPCISFPVGGVPDMVDHLENGYLAEALSSEDFAAGISWMFNDDARLAVMARNARQKIVANHGDIEIARQYATVYRQAAVRQSG
jgi:glycosyltransferase involved in cell wall biosynthesis